ncbi:hypothetical protein Psfp_03838 [Pelotomaculum sp. FP]|nr:hypothetical protein Psfp_03838 [Pelotomaculum sp. FP]
MSRIVLIMLVVITCLALFPVGLVCATTVTLNGETLQFDIPPTVENGRTLVPMRAIRCKCYLEHEFLVPD